MRKRSLLSRCPTYKIRKVTCAVSYHMHSGKRAFLTLRYITFIVDFSLTYLLVTGAQGLWLILYRPRAETLWFGLEFDRLFCSFSIGSWRRIEWIESGFRLKCWAVLCSGAWWAWMLVASGSEIQKVIILRYFRFSHTCFSEFAFWYPLSSFGSRRFERLWCLYLQGWSVREPFAQRSSVTLLTSQLVAVMQLFWLTYPIKKGTLTTALRRCTRVVSKVMSNFFFCMRTGNSRRRRVRW